MKSKSILALLTAIILTMTMMVGCNNDRDNNTSGGSDGGIVSDLESGVSEIGSGITSGAESMISGTESAVTGGSQTAVTGKLKEAYEAVKNLFGEDYIPNMTYDEAYINDQFGISKDMVKQIVAEGPMISVNVDTFIGVEAAEGKAEDVEKALNDYAKMLNEESMQYPMNVEKVKAAQVKRFDDYVFFVLLGAGGTDIMDMEEADRLAYYEGENKKAMDAIAAVMEK